MGDIFGDVFSGVGSALRLALCCMLTVWCVIIFLFPAACPGWCGASFDGVEVTSVVQAGR